MVCGLQGVMLCSFGVCDYIVMVIEIILIVLYFVWVWMVLLMFFQDVEVEFVVWLWFWFFDLNGFNIEFQCVYMIFEVDFVVGCFVVDVVLYDLVGLVLLWVCIVKFGVIIVVMLLMGLLWFDVFEEQFVGYLLIGDLVLILGMNGIIEMVLNDVLIEMYFE